MVHTFSCLVCGKEFVPSRAWQKYCSISCKNRADKNDRRFGGIRDYVIERDKFKCAQCGSENELVVHHKDWIRTNNDPSNLVTLCRSCHKKEHFEVIANNQTKLCVICGEKFHPLTSKRKKQITCRRKMCRAKWKAIQKRSEHEEVGCLICGKKFIQKHSHHLCCSNECSLVYANQKKSERYYKFRDQLKVKQTQYYEANKDRIKTYIKQWQMKNVEKVRAYKVKNALKRKAS